MFVSQFRNAATSLNSAFLLGRAAPAGRLWVWAALGIWSATVTAGMGWLIAYANRAGDTAAALQVIPPAAIASPSIYRLRMFVHPRCPCSRASVNELARIMSRCSESVEATVYFIRPETASEDWVQGPLWISASAIPGVQVQVDDVERTAERFGAMTSGDVFLFDASGQLRFRGGITSARGHEGDNLGESTILAIVQGRDANESDCPVFGCVLHAAPSPGKK